VRFSVREPGLFVGTGFENLLRLLGDVLAKNLYEVIFV